MPTAPWIPTKPAMHSQSEAWPPVPIRSRPGFRFDVGHLRRAAAGRWDDVSFGCRVKR